MSPVKDGHQSPGQALPNNSDAFSTTDDQSSVDGIEEVPPPAYGESYGSIENEQDGFGTRATCTDDGRVNIRINQKTKGLSSLLVPALRSQLDLVGLKGPPPPPYVPASLAGRPGELSPPPLNVVIHVVGSRGDVQPFVALGKVLKEKYGHRVRLATHPVFKDFVIENGLEFFSIAGDPSELMAFMVKNPGLMPDFKALRTGDVGRRRKDIGNMIQRCWRSCIEAGDGSGAEASDKNVEDWANVDSATEMDTTERPFVADAIIANPPSFAHIHCAEKLGIPLHMMFTMPWSPTQSFPHPLANIQSTNVDSNMTNLISYALVEMMTWQGLSDVINRFREKSLNLDPLALMWAPGMLARLHVPWTYCWSPALISKPRDWGSYITISGFYFLETGTNFTPDPDLAAFLEAGPPPVYIGFGSIVVEDPNAMTKLIFDAVKKTGQRALVSKGWGGFGADQVGIPEGIFMLGAVPHDWLFKHVSCVVHHGGAGTTAAGIACGRPTVIVPFFGDQPFWGDMVARAGAGPKPVPYKQLTADLLAAAITDALKSGTLEKAKQMSDSIKHEKGTESGAEDFHRMLDVDKLRCILSPNRAAVWQLKQNSIQLSAFAATVLGNDGLLDFNNLQLYRSREHDTEDEPWDPITGGASALVGTLSSMSMGIADLPTEALKALQIHPDAPKSKAKSKQSSSANPAAESTKAGEPSKEPEEQGSAQNSNDAGPAVAHAVVRNMANATTESEPSNTAAPAAPAAPSSQIESAPTKFDMETAMETGKGVFQFASAGIKSPMDFTLGLARGFHNAPKLYGDQSVRKSEKITDFSSGLRAAGKEFGFGFYDGITGLVTQPVEGAKKEGAVGFFKGFAKGIGGIVFKPGAAIWGIPGYTSRGIYKELQKRFGPSVENYIIAARTAQGYEDVKHSTPAQREAIISDWNIVQSYMKGRKAIGKEQLDEIRAKIHGPTGASANRESGLLTSTDTAPSNESELGQLSAAELEEAIRRSVAETSRGDPEQDALIERAIRASVAELEAERARGADEAELQRTMQASLQEAKAGMQDSHPPNNVNRIQSTAAEEDSALKKALEASMEAHSRISGHAPDVDTENLDEDATLREALEASKEAHGRSAEDEENAKREEEIVMKYVLKQSLAEEGARKRNGARSSGF